MSSPDPLKPHLIPRLKVDSSTILEIGYERGVCVVQFHNGSIFAYQMPAPDFEAFARAESKGKHFNQHVRGKFTATKLTGQCPACGSAPEIIGEPCANCSVGIAVAVEKRYPEAERYDGEARTKKELGEMRKVLGLDEESGKN